MCDKFSIDHVEIIQKDLLSEFTKLLQTRKISSANLARYFFYYFAEESKI